MEQLFGRYNAERELGKGSFGTVYDVIDTVSENRYALKVFSPRWVQRHLLERFRREFALVAKIPHRRIVKVFDFGGEDKSYYFTMELISGTTLDEAKLSNEDKISALCDIAEGLAHIHSRGIIHLDLKPANIFITSDGGKIGDFGLSRALSEEADMMTSGTAAYIAPEVIKGYPPDMRADLYSLGVIAAELFTGKNPFEGATTGETIQFHLHMVIDQSDLAAVPDELRNLIASLLEKDPRDRPNGAYFVWRKLAKLLGRKDDPSLRARFLPDPTLIARDTILARAEQIFSGLSGKSVWTLEGPPGIGYTRILSELKIMAQLANCHPIIVSPTSPMESLLRQVLLWEFGDPLRRHLPVLLWAAPAIINHPAIANIGVSKSHAEPAHEEIDAHLRALLESISQLKPLILLFEDGVSPNILKSIASRPRVGRLLTVTKGLYPERNSCPNETAELSPLQSSHIEEWIKSTLGDVSDMPALVSYILHSSAGIPRKCESTIKELIIRGALSSGLERWRYSPEKAVPIELIIPEAVIESSMKYIAASPFGLPMQTLAALIGENDAPLAVSEMLAMGEISETEKWGYLTYDIRDEEKSDKILDLPDNELSDLMSSVGNALSSCDDSPEFQFSGAKLLFNAGEYEKSIALVKKTIKQLKSKYAFGILFDAYELAIEGAKKLGDEELVFRAIKHKASLLRDMGLFDRAETLYRELLNIARAKADLEKESAMLNDLGVTLFNKAQHKEAISLYRESLELARQLGDEKLELYTIINVSAALHAMGDLQEAATRYWQARSLAQKLSNPISQAAIELNLGTILCSQEKYQQALDSLLTAASIAHENNYTRFHTGALLMIAVAHRKMGNIELSRHAISEYEQVISASARPIDRARMKCEIFWEQLYSGNIHDAGVLFDELLPELASLPHSHYETVLRELLPWLVLSGLPFSEYQKLPSPPEGEPASFVWEALTLFESGQLDSAAEAAQNIIDSLQFKGETGDLWCVAGHILAGTLQPQKAGEVLLKMLGDAPDDPFVQGYLWQRTAEIYAEKVPDPQRGHLALGNAKQFFSRLGNRTKLQELERIADLLRGSRYGGDAGLLLEVAKAFTTTLEINELVRVILDRAVEVSGAGRALLIAVENNEPVVIAARNEDLIDIPPDELAFSSGAVRKAMEQREPLMIESVPEDEELSSRQSILNLRILMVIAAPLFWGDELLGILYADAELRRSAFSERTVRILEALGEFAALALHNASIYGELLAERNALKAQTREHIGAEKIIGEADVMQEIYRKLEAVAAQDVTVLLTGETGTGKDLLAGAIHSDGNRTDKAFIMLNCAAVPETLLEAELFGYEKGAFTGANRQQKGKLQLADGGTLFLDEIGDMSPALQAKLLNAIETGRFMRIGGAEEIQTDVRIIAATNKNLEEEIKNGNFREDLYYRISTVRISLPPLRERREDIPALAVHFLKLSAQKFGKDIKGFSPEVLGQLRAFNWNGNIRQLRNAVEEMVLFAAGEIIGPDLLPEYIRPSSERQIAPDAGQFQIPESYRQLKEIKKTLGYDYEKWVILQLLEKHNYNVSRAAEAFGIHRTRLHQLITKYALRKPES